MARQETNRLSSSQPDLKVLVALGVIHRILVVLLIAIAGFCLSGSLIPRLGDMIPRPVMMKANTALMILLCGASIILSEPRRALIAVRISRLLAG